MLLLTTICLPTFYFVYQFLSRHLQRHRFRHVHGCLPAPRLPQVESLVGLDTVLENLRALRGKCLLNIMKSRFTKAGNTYSATIAGNSMICTIEPENVKAVLAAQFDDFEIGWLRRQAMAPFLGEFIITSDGDNWHRYRTMLRPAFARRQITNYATFAHETDNLISRIPQDGSTVDLSPLFYRLALALGTKLLFDETMSSLKPGFEKATDEFVKAFQDVNSGIELRLRLGRLIPLMPRNHEFEASIAKVHEYGDAFVEKASKYQKRDQEDEKDEKSSEERYVFLREIAEDIRDPVRLRDHLLGLLIVGSETTAGLLTNCLSILKDRRDLWAKMRAEVLQMEDQEPNYEQVRNLTLLNWVVNEGK